MKTYKLGFGKSANQKATADFQAREEIKDWKKDMSSEGRIDWFRILPFNEATMELCKTVDSEGNEGYQPVFSYRTLSFKNPSYDESKDKSAENSSWIWHNDARALGRDDAVFDFYQELIAGLIAEGDEDSLNLVNNKLYNKYNPNVKSRESVTAENPLTWPQITQSTKIICVVPVESKLVDGKSVATTEKPMLIKVPNGVANKLFPYGESDTTKVFSGPMMEHFGSVDIGISYTGQKINTRYSVVTRPMSAVTELAEGPSGQAPETYFLEKNLPSPIAYVESSIRPDETIVALKELLDLSDVGEVVADATPERGDAFEDTKAVTEKKPAKDIFA